jgi:two-component system chemotaxis sensor kinase CheA
MPDISGYELTKRIKKDEMLSGIPVILVTSLASEVDRQKGLTAGASAYITKGGFDQEELLGTIRRLLN